MLYTARVCLAMRSEKRSTPAPLVLFAVQLEQFVPSSTSVPPSCLSH